MRKINSPQRSAAFLYQWTKFKIDFENFDNLGRLGGNGPAANKFRGIEDDLKNDPHFPHCVIAAQRHKGIWRVSALLKARLPTVGERSRTGDFDKYLYFDEEESGFLALPNESPVENAFIDKALNERMPTNTRGLNGTEFEVTEETIKLLKNSIKLTIRDRKKELSVGHTTDLDLVDNDDQQTEPEATPPDVENSHLSSEMPSSSIPALDQIQLQQDTGALETSEREAVVKVRYGQGKFREALIAIDGAKCWMSRIDGRLLLIASHIKPWSACEDDTGSRGNSNNGLLLSSLWDAAFDSGLITFGKDWQVLASVKLSESARGALNIKENTCLPERYRNDVRGEYLAYHRSNVFERWKKSTTAL